MHDNTNEWVITNKNALKKNKNALSHCLIIHVICNSICTHAKTTTQDWLNE